MSPAANEFSYISLIQITSRYQLNAYIEYISVLAYHYPSIYDWLDTNGYLRLLHGIQCTYAPTHFFTLQLILERKTKNVQRLIENLRGVIECNQITSTLLSTYPSILSNGMQYDD